MTTEAQAILDVFRSLGIRAGGVLQPNEFGDAIVWEAGFVRDAPVREALAYLFDNDLLVEFANGFGLTVAGERAAYSG